VLCEPLNVPPDTITAARDGKVFDGAGHRAELELRVALGWAWERSEVGPGEAKHSECKVEKSVWRGCTTSAKPEAAGK